MIVPRTVAPWGRFWAVYIDDHRLIPFMDRTMAAECYLHLMTGETTIDQWEIVDDEKTK